MLLSHERARVQIFGAASCSWRVLIARERLQTSELDPFACLHCERATSLSKKTAKTTAIEKECGLPTLCGMATRARVCVLSKHGECSEVSPCAHTQQGRMVLVCADERMAWTWSGSSEANEGQHKSQISTLEPRQSADSGNARAVILQQISTQHEDSSVARITPASMVSRPRVTWIRPFMTDPVHLHAHICTLTLAHAASTSRQQNRRRRRHHRCRR